MSNFPNENERQVPTKTSTFFKGGCGCLLAFFVLVVLALVIPGGHVDVHGGPFGLAVFFLVLFLIGGGLGLLVRWIYTKGFDAGRKP